MFVTINLGRNSSLLIESIFFATLKLIGSEEETDVEKIILISVLDKKFNIIVNTRGEIQCTKNIVKASLKSVY